MNQLYVFLLSLRETCIHSPNPALYFLPQCLFSPQGKKFHFEFKNANTFPVSANIHVTVQHAFILNCFIIKLSKNVHIIAIGSLKLNLPLVFYHLSEHWEIIWGDVCSVNDAEATVGYLGVSSETVPDVNDAHYKLTSLVKFLLILYVYH